MALRPAAVLEDQLKPQEDNLLEATVGHVENLGDLSIVYANLPGVDGMVAVKQAAEGLQLAPGSAARLHLPAARCLLFNSDGQAYARAV